MRIRRLLTDLSPENDMVSYEHAIADKEQNLHWQQWTDRAVFNNAGKLIEYRSVGCDITKQKLGQRRSDSRSQRRVNALTVLAAQALSGVDQEKLLRSLCEEIVAGLDAKCGLVMQRDKEAAHFIVRAAWGLPIGLINSATLTDDVNTLPGFTLQNISPQVIDDLTSEKRFIVPDWLLEKGLGGGLCAPVIDQDDEPWGIIAAFNEHKHTFEPGDAAFLNSINSILRVSLPRRKDHDTALFSNESAAAQERENWERKFALTQLVREVATAANRAESREDVFRIALSRVCAHTGWPLGHVFQTELHTGRLLTSRVWYVQSGRNFSEFKHATESVGYAHNTGLPNRAAQTKQPVWLAELGKVPEFQRAAAAQLDGIRSGLAVPVYLDDSVVAVLEFFNDQVTKPDDLLLDALRDISAQISPVIERAQAEERVRDQIRQQKMIAMLGQDALSGSQRDELFLRAVLTLRGTLDVEMCDILELQPHENTLFLKEGVGWQEGKVGTVTMSASAAMLPGFALSSELPVISDNRKSDNRFSVPDLYLSHGVISSVCIPIVGSKDSYGVLGIHSRKSKQYNQEQIAFAQSVASILAQVVERYRAEDALRESRERFATLTANIPGFVFRLVMDSKGSGAFAYVSPGAREIFDTNPSDLTTDVSPLVEAIHPEDRPSYYRSVAESANTLQQWCWGGRVRVGNGFKWLQGMARPFRGADGSTTWDGVILDDTARKSAEVRTQALLDDNRRLTKKLLSIQEEEYRRLARELHDELGQSLTAIKSDSILIKKHTETESKAHISAVAIEEAAEHIYDVTHAMMRRLRPSTLDELGLADTLHQMVSDWCQRSGIACSLQADEQIDHLDDEYAITIYRVIQESLTNVERHSHATRVEIFINVYVASVGPGYLVMYIKDNGKGTVSDDTITLDGHYGILGIRERIEAIGGDLEISSRSGQGFQLRAHIPLLAGLMDNVKIKGSE